MRIINKLLLLADIKAYQSLFRYSEGYRLRITWLTLFEVVSAVLQVCIAVITKELVDSAINSNLEKAVSRGIVLLVILTIIMISNALITYQAVKIVEEMKKVKQLELMSSLYRKEWVYINPYTSGELLTRLYDDVGHVIYVLTSIIPSIIALFIHMFLAFGVLAFYDSLLAVLAFLISPVTILISMFIGRLLRGIQDIIMEEEGHQKSKINEALQNAIIIKTYSYVSTTIEFIQQIYDRKITQIKRKSKINIYVNGAMNIGSVVGIMAAIGLGAYRLFMKSISFGTYTAFIQLVNQIQVPIEGIASQLPSLISGFSSLDRIMEIQRIPEEVAKVEEVTERFDSIILKNIDFAYDEELILKNFSLHIDEGDRIGVTGPSGKGKTTLLHLLMTLITPDRGEAYVITGKKKIELNSSTRNLFAYVPQNNSLFSGTIRENMMLTKEVAQEELNKALTAACADKFIDTLPKGLETHLKEGGIGLSQGQLQRLAIVRAILHNAPILVFDEATSALDYDTEQHVVENIKEYYPEKTIIAVTHRKRILEICDKIIEL